VPGLIRTIRWSLAELDPRRGVESVGSGLPAGRPTTRPAVEIRRSVFPDHLICLEDGAKLKTLKRHLSAEHGLTPEAYRAKWNLPANYPMVAPDYAKARSRMAKAAGLGRNAKTP
jgi:predicted transcriptional regulator